MSSNNERIKLFFIQLEQKYYLYIENNKMI